MPTTAGVYTADLENGTEVSSTYEGRHLTMVEDELMHPLHAADAFVNKGDPVIIARALGATPHTAYGLAVGVALNDAAALTDLIAIDTEGIFNLNVNAFDDNGGVDVNPGDALFISDDSAGTDDSSHDGVGNAVISKIRNNAIQIPFGYALGFIAANAFGVIAVKVHWDPRAHWLLDDEMLYFGDDRDVSVEWDGTNLEILPLTDDTGSILIGNATHHVNSVQIFGIGVASYWLYDTDIARMSLVNTTLGNDARIASYHGTMATPTLGDGVGMVEIDLTVTGEATVCSVASSTWVNVVGTAKLDASNVNVCSPRNDGVYAPASTTITGAPIAYGGRFQAILTDTDFNWLAMFSANVSVVQTAIFHVNSSPNFGYVAGDHDDDTNIGSIPLMCDIDGGSVKWVRVYAAAA